MLYDNNILKTMSEQDRPCAKYEDVIDSVEMRSDVDKKLKKIKKKIRKLKEKKQYQYLSDKKQRKLKRKLKRLKNQQATMCQKKEQFVPKNLYDNILRENQQMHKEKMFMAMVILDKHPDKDNILRDLSTQVVKKELNCSKTQKLPAKPNVKDNTQQSIVEGNGEWTE